MTTYDNDNDITIHLTNLPGNVRAFSFPSDRGYVVVLNQSMTRKAMRLSYRHELNHIEQGDHHDTHYTEY